MFLCTWPLLLSCFFFRLVCERRCRLGYLAPARLPWCVPGLLHPQSFPDADASRWGPRWVLRRKTLFYGTTAGETPALQSFGGSQLRAARPRIAIDFFFIGRHRLFRQQAVVTSFRAFAKSIFHDAVFQRVETDDHQPASRFQQPRGCFHQRPQVVEFAVYEDSESLKGARRGMNSSFRLIHWPGRG